MIGVVSYHAPARFPTPPECAARAAAHGQNVISVCHVILATLVAVLR